MFLNGGGSNKYLESPINFSFVEFLEFCWKCQSLSAFTNASQPSCVVRIVFAAFVLICENHKKQIAKKKKIKNNHMFITLCIAYELKYEKRKIFLRSLNMLQCIFSLYILSAVLFCYYVRLDFFSFPRTISIPKHTRSQAKDIKVIVSKWIFMQKTYVNLVFLENSPPNCHKIRISGSIKV